MASALPVTVMGSSAPKIVFVRKNGVTRWCGSQLKAASQACVRGVVKHGVDTVGGHCFVLCVRDSAVFSLDAVGCAGLVRVQQGSGSVAAARFIYGCLRVGRCLAIKSSSAAARSIFAHAARKSSEHTSRLSAVDTSQLMKRVGFICLRSGLLLAKTTTCGLLSCPTMPEHL